MKIYEMNRMTDIYSAHDEIHALWTDTTGKYVTREWQPKIKISTVYHSCIVTQVETTEWTLYF